VLGYHRCPNLCGLVMHGVLEALAAGGLQRSTYRVLAISIDPDETAADANARRTIELAYAASLAPQPPAVPLELQALVGKAADIRALTQQVGFEYRQDPTNAADGSRYAHPAGMVILTPSGQVSRYLFGVRFDAQALRRALVDAGSGQVGTLADRLLLLCAHFDPRTGRHDAAVMNLLRGVGLVLVLALGTYAWRHRRPESRARS